MGEFAQKDGTTNVDFLMYDGDFFVPVIRLDLLERHGLPLPNTWQEVVDIAKLNADLATTVAKIDQLRADIDAIVAEIEA